MGLGRRERWELRPLEPLMEEQIDASAAAIDAGRAPPVVRDFLSESRPIDRFPALRQRLFRCSGGASASWRPVCITRPAMGRACCDGWSISSRSRRESPRRQRRARGDFGAPVLRKRKRKGHRGSAAPWGPSARLFSAGDVNSAERGFLSFWVRTEGLRTSAARIGARSVSELLAAVVLTAAASWNRWQGRSPRVGLWTPVDIRRRRGEGFGNGSSRVRLYLEPQLLDAGWAERCRSLRAAIQRAVAQRSVGGARRRRAPRKAVARLGARDVATPVDRQREPGLHPCRGRARATGLASGRSDRRAGSSARPSSPWDRVDVLARPDLHHLALRSREALTRRSLALLGETMAVRRRGDVRGSLNDLARAGFGVLFRAMGVVLRVWLRLRAVSFTRVQRGVRRPLRGRLGHPDSSVVGRGRTSAGGAGGEPRHLLDRRDFRE